MHYAANALCMDSGGFIGVCGADLHWGGYTTHWGGQKRCQWGGWKVYNGADVKHRHLPPGLKKQVI